MLSLSGQNKETQRAMPLLKRIARWLRWRLPRTIRPHRIVSGPLKGKKIVTSWRDYPAAIAGITEPRLLDWFAKNVKAGETWLDIGAHFGYTALALGEHVGASGRVFAFEPMASTVGCLARTRLVNDLPALTIVPIALGDVADLELQKIATVRGMADSTVGTGVEAKVWSETIQVARFDWLWPRIAGAENAPVHGVKIDVQGMELHVLRGMALTLRAQRPKLVVELHEGVDRTEILTLLESLGYSSRSALPVEPVAGETQAQFVNDRSYAFSIAHAAG